MNLIDSLNFLSEKTGSDEGRKVYTSKQGTKRDLTKSRKGKGSAKLAAKYGSRTQRKARGIGGADGRLDKG